MTPVDETIDLTNSEDEDDVLSSALNRISLLPRSDDDASANVNADWQSTGHSSTRRGPRAKKQAFRNGPVVYPRQTIDVLPLQSWYVRPGDTVELHHELGDLLYVMKIIEDIETGERYLHGLRLRHTEFVGALDPEQTNEVCFVLQEDEDDPRDTWTQGVVEVPAEQALRRRNVIFSTKDFPQDSFQDIFPETQIHANLTEIEDRGRLVCRWVLVETFESAIKRKRLQVSGGYLRRLVDRECADDSFFISTSNNVPASHQPPNPSVANRPRAKRGTYTYASGFCGAGGDALGAKLAGLDVRYAWDSDPSACETIRRNFPHTTVFCCQAADFPPKGFKPTVDVLHLSFPCRYFSPNHSTEGKDDEENTTVIFNLEKLLLDAKPIYHTQENTFGLLKRHPMWLNFMLRMIIKVGYDVRWKVLDFPDFGLPANRKRLVIFAARRGYPLPNFPSPTHGDHNRRYVYDAIANIPPNASWHLDHAYPSRRPRPSPRPPYDARTTLAKCICTNGGKNYHPSGQRNFTPRELACLQTVPCNFEFCGNKTAVIKLIGNILPPEIWRKFLEQVVKTLDDFNDRFIDDLGNPIQRARHAESFALSTFDQRARHAESFALSTSSNVANPIQRARHAESFGLPTFDQRARHAESFALSTSSNVANSRHSIPLTSNPPLPTNAGASRRSLSQAGPSQTDIVMIDDDEEDDDVVVAQSRSSREIVDLTKE